MEAFHAAQGQKSIYQCGECGEPVIPLKDGKLYKPCGHADATVLANMEAVATGEAGILG